jgi:hypothetical protein
MTVEKTELSEDYPKKISGAQALKDGYVSLCHLVPRGSLTQRHKYSSIVSDKFVARSAS